MKKCRSTSRTGRCGYRDPRCDQGLTWWVIGTGKISYIRVGSTSRLATHEQQARWYALGGMLHAELLPVSGSGLADLSQDRLKDYLSSIVGDKTDRQTLMDKRGEGVRIILANSRRLSGRIPDYRMIRDAKLMLTIYGGSLSRGPGEKPREP